MRAGWVVISLLVAGFAASPRSAAPGGSSAGLRAMMTFVLGLESTALIGPFMPLSVGQTWTSHQHDANDPSGWPVYMRVTGTATFGDHDYFCLEVENYYQSPVEEAGCVRSTEEALYSYDPTAGEYIEAQLAPAGTKWIVAQDKHGYHYKVIEIVAVESVTVPYGTFDPAYKRRHYYCNDPNNLSLGKSPDCYDWFVAGVGMVKEEDYWCDYPPGISELVSMSQAPGAEAHDWNGDGIVSIIGDVPPFVRCVYFNNCPAGADPVTVGDCNHDGILSIIGDVPCFVDCVYFQNCPE